MTLRGDENDDDPDDTVVSRLEDRVPDSIGPLPTRYRVTLEILAGDAVARRVPISMNRSILGRGKDAVDLNDPLLSRKHAMLEVFSPQFVQIWDLGSRNGTFVNDAPLTSLRKLTPTDVIRAGSTRFRVRVEVTTEGGAGS